jgi:hypothetical protein
MVIEKDPFTRYKTNEEKEEEEIQFGEIMTIRLNPVEKQWIEKWKKVLDIKSDGKTLKFLAEIGTNVLHSTFGDKKLGYLFKKDRQRLSDYENF